MNPLDELTKQVQKLRGPEVLKGVFLNAWIYGSLSLSVKDRNSESSEESLDKLNGACGHRDILFRAICDRLNLKSRRIGFHNIPIQIAHVGTEVWIDGEWRFFDPTFGTFIAAIAEPNIPISLDDARKRFPDVEIRRTKTPAYQGKWLRSVSPNSEVLPRGTMNHATGGWPILKPYESYLYSDIVPEDETGTFVSEMAVPVTETTQIELSETDLQKSHLDLGYGQTYVAYANTLGLSHGRGPLTSLSIDLRPDAEREVQVSLKTRYAPLDRIVGGVRHTVLDFSEAALTVDRTESEDGWIHWRFPVRPEGSTFKISTLGEVSAIIENLVITSV